MSDFVVAYCGDVAAADQELHHLGAFAGKLGPSRRGRRILLEAADALAGKFEIHLRELAFRRALHGIGIVAYDYTLFATIPIPCSARRTASSRKWISNLPASASAASSRILRPRRDGPSLPAKAPR